MSSYQNPGAGEFQFVLDALFSDPNLPFGDVLTADDVASAFEEEGVSFGTCAKAIYTMPVTFTLFLWQTVASESCQAAVLRGVAMLALSTPPSKDTGAYCRARAKITEGVIGRLTVDLARALEDAAPASWLWCERHVVLVDGTTASMPDTEENQKEFPQPKSQKPGLGFPMIRMVLLLSLATAMILGMDMGPCEGKETGETALFRKLLDKLKPGEIVLADRFYCSYFMIALARARGLDVVFRLHQSRHCDFRTGQRLDADDHVTTWTRPVKPDWMDDETYATIPETMTIREVRVTVRTSGFRVRNLVVATTLTDADTYAAEDVGDLYHQRWHVELDIRSMNIPMKVDILSCQTPFMIRKELWMKLFAYNLVRKVAAQAAVLAERSPREVSFMAARQTHTTAWNKWSDAEPAARLTTCRALLTALGQVRVGHRPGRVEPRAKKRRPKSYPRLQQPRARAQAALRRRRRGPGKAANKDNGHRQRTTKRPRSAERASGT